jgi:hypothetical protein
MWCKDKEQARKMREAMAARLWELRSMVGGLPGGGGGSLTSAAMGGARGGDPQWAAS